MNNASERLHQSLEQGRELDAARKRIAELEGQLATAKMVGRKGAFEDVCQSLKTFPHNVHDSDVYNGIKDLLATARQLGALEALEQAQEQEQFTGYDIAVWLDNRITELRKEIECHVTT